MPVNQADRDQLAWLRADSQQAQCKILLPLNGKRPKRLAQIAANPVVTIAREDAMMGSDGDDYDSAQNSDTGEDDPLEGTEDLRADERLGPYLMELADVERPGPDVIVPERLVQLPEESVDSNEDEPISLEYDEIEFPNWIEYPFAKPAPGDVIRTGKVHFSGPYWPHQPAMRQQITAAYAEAWAMIASGRAVAELALRGDVAAAQKMTNWFGPRDANAPASEDWWLGVSLILEKLHHYRGRALYVYFNADGQEDAQQDWPRAGVYENAIIKAKHLEGYGSSVNRAHDMVVVFHKEYCNKQGLRVTTQPGYTNAASVIVHELTHCLGGAEDHKFNSLLIYNFNDALSFGITQPAQAWYNAANLEYFCVQALHGDVGAGVASYRQRLFS
jgi:hypothetical protein